MNKRKHGNCPQCGGPLRAETLGWRCNNCRGFIDMIGGKFYAYEEKPFFPPMTNGDRIRAMSDEELADTWMRDFVICHRCAYRYECECDEYVTIEKCREGIVEWLKQPPKEEE